MKQGDRVYVVVSTWGCYSDYVEKVLYVTDDRQKAVDEAARCQIRLNAKYLAARIADNFCIPEYIDEDSTLVLRSYPFEQSIDGLTEAERQSYHVDENTLYEAEKVNAKIDGKEMNLYQLKPTEAKS